MYSSPVVFEPYWELSGKTTCQIKQSAYVAQLPCHWLNSSGCVDLAGLVMSYAIMNYEYMKSCFHKLTLKGLVVTEL